ncbi:MAG: hypothetical protein RMI78_03860 [Nitrososphaerota archaeon]|nr:hypothetical protein [Nitrososphaerota archaeon]
MPAILDTTLREGELYRKFDLEVKVEIARSLAEAGLDRIELTVDYPPRTTREEVAAVVDALRSYDVEVVIHGRAYPRDVEAAAYYDVGGIGVYIAPTEIHRRFKFGGMSLEEAKTRMKEALELSKAYGFNYRRATIEDASRYYFGEDGGLEALASLVDEFGEAGATIVSVPDTCGALTPTQSRDFFQRLKRLCRTPLSAHFHNDYGHASANTLEAALVGADELHVSILGIGDRNGIADLYEVAAPLLDVHGFDLKVKRDQLKSLYGKFCRLTGIRMPFRHPLSSDAQTIRAGVHQSMVINAPEGYVPAGKLRHDFGRILLEATPYLSKKLVEKIICGEVGEEKLQAISAELGRLACQRGGTLSSREIVEYLQSMGLEVDRKALNKLLRPQKAYILLNLDPQYPVKDMVRVILEWDEVEQVDEVYGDADLVVVARIEREVVKRLRKRFGKAIVRMRTLLTD